MSPSIESTTSYPQHLLSIPYSPLSTLNTLDIHIPAPLSPTNARRYWIIYLHGGAWRDPLQTSLTILPTLPHLLPHPHIAALASLNYRLSPHPTHPTSPSQPSDPARSARHPDHLADVLAGIRWLQRAYGFGARYVLVGHSAGAWLGGWVCRGLEECGGMRGEGNEEEEEGEEAIPKPLAWVPVCGIYDLPLLWATHRSQAAYHDFLAGAFGPEEEGKWEQAGLRRCGFEGWAEGRVVLLGHGRGDELVDWVQVEGMEKGLRGGWGRGGEGRRVRVLEVEGGHEEVWRGGREMARVIRVAVGMLVEAEGVREEEGGWDGEGGGGDEVVVGEGLGAE